ncbi:MAG: hypothetical protein IPJ14_02695 [Kineosporiaceae bacterium]|nr:hypothetical protein [Kineosporiaceae bacterium]
MDDASRAARLAPDLALWAAIVAWAGCWAAFQAQPSGISWHFFADGSRQLFGADGLHLYARNPGFQIGPLAFLVARPLTLLPTPWDRAVAEALMAATGPAVLAWLAPLTTGPRRRWRILAAAAVLIPPWTALAVRWAHLDDVLALALAVVAVRAVATRRPVVAGLALGGALAAKPWAIGFAPILLNLDGAVLLAESTMLAAGLAASVVIVTWGSFLAADHATLTALRPSVWVAESSGLRTLGYSGHLVPSWGRTAQLVAAPGAALISVLRGRWAGALLVAVAVRLALDPQDIAYYAAGGVLAALVFDLLATRSTLPWTAIVTSIVLWQPFIIDVDHRFEVATGPALWWFRHPAAVGWIHLTWAVAVVVLVMVWRPGTTRATEPSSHRAPPRHDHVEDHGEGMRQVHPHASLNVILPPSEIPHRDLQRDHHRGCRG